MVHRDNRVIEAAVSAARSHHTGVGRTELGSLWMR
jgi:hypothetical protein